MIRVPVRKKGKPESARIEYRALDGAANPYLAFSLILAAGLRGIEEGYELPETDANLFELSDSERRPWGRAAPRSLNEALDVMEESKLAREPSANTSSSGSSATSEPSGPNSSRGSPLRTRALPRQLVNSMDPLLVFPSPAPPELAQALDLGGWAWKAAADLDTAKRAARRRLGRRGRRGRR